MLTPTAPSPSRNVRKRRADEGERSKRQTRGISQLRSCRNLQTWLAITPVPIMPTCRTRRDPMKSSAARTAEAAVRVAEIVDASKTAYGYPVSISLRIKAAAARGKPTSLFDGKLEIHLIPAISNAPPRYAGREISRLPGLLGILKNELSGFELSPRACVR